MEEVKRDGKKYLIYMDAEFQTYRSLIANDTLAAAGYRLTPPFVHYPNDHIYNTYQFLLNIAFIVIDESGMSYNYLATFPSLLNTAPFFSDGRILEPGYTVASPPIIEQMVANRPQVPKFAFLSSIQDMQAKKQFANMNALYQSEFSKEKTAGSLALLAFLLSEIGPQSKIVHKGHTDIDAIFNTCAHYTMGVPVLNTRNLNHFSHKYVGLYGEEHDKKLNTLQELFCSKDEQLRYIRDYMIEGAQQFMVGIYGAGVGAAVAHNPLVDCVYTYILDIATARYLSDKPT